VPVAGDECDAYVGGASWPVSLGALRLGSLKQRLFALVVQQIKTSAIAIRYGNITMSVERQPQGVVITELYHHHDKILIIVKNGSTITAWLIRSALVSAGVLLTWRIVVLGMSQFYTDQITPSSQHAALAWYSKHPEALRRVARDIALRNLAGAEVSLREAFTVRAA
jgi:hypothetical protein